MLKIARKYVFVLLSVLCVMGIGGCGMQVDLSEIEDKAEETETEEAENHAITTPTDDNMIVVGVSQVGSESVWRSAHTDSIQNVFTKEEGYFMIFQNARQKQENQIKAIRSFISQQVDYIVISPITENGWDTVLQEAKDAGIPVILTDRKVNVEDKSLYTAWVGSNFVEEGQKAGRWLEQYLVEQNKQDEQINIVVLSGTEGSTAEMGRSAGFSYISQTHENWVVLESVNAEYTTAKGKEEMSKLLKKYNDIDVVVSQNDDMTFGALEAINEAGMTTGVNGDITMISFDGVKAALELVEQGIINVDVECNPQQGKYIARIIRRLRRGAPVERAFYVPEMVFTQENVSEYLGDRVY